MYLCMHFKENDSMYLVCYIKIRYLLTQPAHRPIRIQRKVTYVSMILFLLPVRVRPTIISTYYM